MSIKLSAFAKAIHATLYGSDIPLPSIAIDSRKIQPLEGFFALKGERFDGHDYIKSAIEKGAIAIIAQRDPQTDLEKTVTFLQVDDTTKALGQLAAFWRDHFTLPIVGLTGSSGKTTVKAMCEAICQLKGKTLATKGNLNNQFGLPLTLLRLEASHEFSVLEMGANHLGEIRYLGQIARPNIALITNVSPAHLQGFGSLQGVAQAKGEIYEILPSDGIAILNLDDAFVDYWRQKIGRRQSVTFGLKREAMIRASDIHLGDFNTEFTLHLPVDMASPEREVQHRVMLKVPGQHNVMNALASAAVGVALGLEGQTIVKALSTFTAVAGRLRHFQGWKNAWIIDDSYNANPGSMKAALEVLAHCKGKKIFVMGDMGELGSESLAYHAEVGVYAQKKGITCLLAVGQWSEHAVKAFGEGARLYPNKEALVSHLKKLLTETEETTVLIKGSRSQGMEMVTEALTIREEV